MQVEVHPPPPPQGVLENELDNDEEDEEEMQEEEVDNSQLATFLVQKEKTLYSLNEINQFLDSTYGKQSIEVSDFFPDIDKFTKSVEIVKQVTDYDQLSKQKRFRLNKIMTKLKKGKTVRRLRKDK